MISLTGMIGRDCRPAATTRYASQAPASLCMLRELCTTEAVETIGPAFLRCARVTLFIVIVFLMVYGNPVRACAVSDSVKGGDARRSTYFSESNYPVSPPMHLRLANRYPGMFGATVSTESTVDTSGIDHTRLWILGSSLFAANTGIMVYYFTTFYNDEYAKRAPFHTFNDWYNADLNVDKLGHIWGAQMYTNVLYHMFRWTNMSEKSSMYWSSGLSFLFQLEMEITDGLYEAWGFSWWDMATNTVGAVLPNLQRTYPSLQVVQLKMSYRPSDAVRKGWIKHDYLRDYDGFTYWLAFDVHSMLPQSMKPWWPDWLNIAVGYGANRTMLGKGVYNSKDGVGQGEQEWYVALDYDIRKLPGDTAFLRFLKENLNYFHWPSPAIRFTPSTIYYGLFF